jgi:hypothetical protein
VRDLPLQVGEVDPVVVDDRDPADAGTAEEQQRRRPEPAGADDERMRGEELALALDADLVKQQVARVAQQVVVVHRGAEVKTPVRGTGVGARARSATLSWSCRPRPCARPPPSCWR